MIATLPATKAPRRVNIPRAEGMTSYKLSKLVMQIPMSRSLRVVLRAMADRYPNIWPSINKLAKETGYSERWVQERLRFLESSGYVTPLGSMKGGRGHSVQYALNVDKIISRIERLEDDYKRWDREDAEELNRQKGEPNAGNTTAIKGELASTKGELASEKGEVNAPFIPERVNSVPRKGAVAAPEHIIRTEKLKDNREENISTSTTSDADVADEHTFLSTQTHRAAEPETPLSEKNAFFLRQELAWADEEANWNDVPFVKTRKHLEESYAVYQKYGDRYLAALRYWLDQRAWNDLKLGEDREANLVINKTWTLKAFLDQGLLYSLEMTKPTASATAPPQPVAA